MILVDFGRAVAQLGDPRFRRVLWIGVLLSIALLVAAYALFLWLLAGFVPDAVTLPGIGPVTWVGDLLGIGSVFLMLFFSMFLMIPVASAITSLFLDDVADAVERAHFPHLPPAGRVSFGEGVKETVNFLGLLIFGNVAALMVYPFVPFLAPVIFFALNGFLLGREYFQIAALRRMRPADAAALRRDHRGTVWLAGCLMALPLAIPVVNLLIPVLGAATFTHLFHRLAGTPRGAVSRR